MKTIETIVYNFDELSETAKENARNWYLAHGLQYDWWESTYEDAANIGLKLNSFDLDRNRHATGKFTKDAPSVADLIIKEHGEQCETRKTAEAFLKQRDDIIDGAEKDENGEFKFVNLLDDKLDECEAEFLKSLLEDYSIMLQKESEYLSSKKSVDENIRANEYTFTENGKRF